MATARPRAAEVEKEPFVEAEPFSETWNEPERDDDDRPREAWVDADTCLAPERDRDASPYGEFVERALGIFDARGELASVRISPSFSPEYAISLGRRADGAYVVRRVSLKSSVWDQMMEQMHALQGDSIQLDYASQRAALARVKPDIDTQEGTLDPSTARLWMSLWRALLARTQVVKPIGAERFKMDGTLYRLSLGSHVGTTHSPDGGGVLQAVTTALEHIDRIVTGRSQDDAADLDVARNLMQSALERTQKQESCLRRIELER